MKTLANFAVKCYAPNSDLYSYFTISSIALDTNIEKLQNEIGQQNYLDIVKIERLKTCDRLPWMADCTEEGKELSKLRSIHVIISISSHILVVHNVDSLI